MKMYKNISTVFFAVLVAMGFAGCSNHSDDINHPDGDTIEASALPQASRTTLNTYFNDATITSARRSGSANIYGSIYKALLSNGFEIDFDKDGLWTEVESEKNLPIPSKFFEDQLPEIQAYIEANYARSHVVEIEREQFGFTVELDNGIDLVFDREQRFIGIDLDDNDDDEIRIPLEQLPEKARMFLSTSFSGATAITIKKDRDDNETTFEVYLDNGIKVQFNEGGDWIEIESKRNVIIPAALIPTTIAAYILQSYPAYAVKEIEKNRNGSFTIEIQHTSTGRDLELDFDANGNFVRVDD
jgi:hypothetical protein